MAPSLVVDERLITAKFVNPLATAVASINSRGNIVAIFMGILLLVNLIVGGWLVLCFVGNIGTMTIILLRSIAVSITTIMASSGTSPAARNRYVLVSAMGRVPLGTSPRHPLALGT